MVSPEFLELIVEAHQNGLETTINELRKLPDFSDLGAMAACEEIAAVLQDKGLEIRPSVTEGELEQPRVVSRTKTPEKFQQALDDALSTDEGQEVEFKESLYLKKAVYGNNDVPRKHWVSEELIFECIKTICAFLNSDGGTLLIGVSNDREVCGVECELEFIPSQPGNLDKWELFFSSCLEKYIYDYRSCMGHVSRKIVTNAGQSVCVVMVRPRRQGITVCKHPKQMNDEIVYVRNGNESAQIKARAIEALILSRLG